MEEAAEATAQALRVFERQRRRPRPVPRPAARGVAQLERGARGGAPPSRGSVPPPTRGGPVTGTSTTRSWPGSPRRSGSDRPRRRRHPPLRGDARARCGRARRPRPRSCATSPACTRWSAGSTSRADLLADEQRRLRRPRPHPERGDVAERGGRRTARREPRRGRGEPARRISRARSRWASAPTAPPPPPSWRGRLLEQGRDGEAEDVAGLSARLAARGDLLTQILWRARARPRARAARGDRRGRGAGARGGGASPSATDFLNHRADAMLDLVARCSRAARRGAGGDRRRVARRCASTSRRGTTVAAAAARLRLGELAENVRS